MHSASGAGARQRGILAGLGGLCETQLGKNQPRRLLWRRTGRMANVPDMGQSLPNPLWARLWARRSAMRVAAVAACAAGLLILAASSGCVQRRMTIRSNPPGALVYVDDYQIGTTPVSADFIYYGTRKIRLVKDGFETLTVRQPFPIPWYEVFPLDLVSENLWPAEIRDERVVDLAMAPALSTPPEEVVARAQQARLAAGSLPAPPPQPRAVVPAPIPAPPPGQLLPPPPASQPPLQFPAPSLQAPLQNAPSQGIPNLGGPPSMQ